MLDFSLRCALRIDVDPCTKTRCKICSNSFISGHFIFIGVGKLCICYLEYCTCYLIIAFTRELDYGVVAFAACCYNRRVINFHE